jgi:nitrite reductase (cytochrome c-552)
MERTARRLAALAGTFVAGALVAGSFAAVPASFAEEAESDGAALAAQILEEAQIVPAEDWAETYPNEYASLLENADNDEIVSYLEEYPYLSTIYNGIGFAKDYGSARGHTYTLEDVAATERPHPYANCLSCKTPAMNALIASGNDAVYTLDFQDVLDLSDEAVSCYTCHENTGDELVVTNTFLTEALGDDADEVDAANLVCGQCHDEYYFAGDAKATTLPYTSLDTMNPDDILAYYDELGFVDFTNPDTGVGLIKVQHPEFETYLGEGSVMAALGYTCADCHMGTATADDGTEYANHNLTSPLDNEELIESTCSNCHADIVAEVAEIQEEAEARTNEIGYKLQDLTDQLAEAVANETIDDETYAAVAELNRDAQFYWDFVFVENSEGAHNSVLTNDCLDKADDLVDQALELLAE